MGRIIIDKKKPGKIAVCFALSLIFLISPVYALGSLKIERISSELSGPQIKYKIAYPRLAGIKDETMQHKLNVGFMEKAKAVRTRVVFEAKSTNVNGSVDYEVKRNQGGVLSLVIKERENEGNDTKLSQSGITINTVTGRQYLISDIFIDHADYVATLNEQVKAQIRRQHLDTALVKEFNSISENADYYLTDNALVLFFGQGEYFNDKVGVKEFSVPLEALDGIIKPQFIIKKS